MKSLSSLSLFLLFMMLVGCSHRPVYIDVPDAMPAARPIKANSVALVLGGGGARGLAHAGVISVLEEHNIPFDFIVGTSIGSVVGALYADDPNSHRLKEKMIKVKKWDILDISFYAGMRMIWDVSGFADGHALRQYLKNHLSAHDFDGLSMPVAMVTTDIEKGEVLILRSGPIIPAVHASSAVPVVFTPVKMYHRMLVDGGVMSPVPVEVAKQLGAKKVIAVDIGNVVKPRKVRGVVDLSDRSLWLSYMALTAWQIQEADILIQPDFDTTSMFDDTKLEDYYEAGRKAALAVLPQLKQLT